MCKVAVYPDFEEMPVFSTGGFKFTRRSGIFLTDRLHFLLPVHSSCIQERRLKTIQPFKVEYENSKNQNLGTNFIYFMPYRTAPIVLDTGL